MALIQCSECKKKISENAETCPNCGNIITYRMVYEYKDKQRRMMKKSLIFLAISVALLLFVSLIFSGDDTKTNSTTPSENIATTTSTQETPVVEIVRNSSWDSSVSQVRVWLKENLNDPKSLEFIEWSKVVKNGNGSFKVRVKYRAKNSFGGYIVNNQVITLDASGNVINFKDF
jgi:predicted nucleic acid-binding Zn ribbon protein